MFKPNTKHLQPAIITAASELPEKQQKRLKASWADTFFQELFCRLDEAPFSVLYSEKASRPNVPVTPLQKGMDATFSWRKWGKAVKICPKYLLIAHKKAENAIKVGEN